MKKPTLVDDVACVVRALWDQELFRALIDPAGHVEGSQQMDRFKAASMVRDRARELALDAGGATLTEINRALTHALRRYGIITKKRAA